MPFLTNGLPFQCVWFKFLQCSYNFIIIFSTSCSCHYIIQTDFQCFRNIQQSHCWKSFFSCFNLIQKFFWNIWQVLLTVPLYILCHCEASKSVHLLSIRSPFPLFFIHYLIIMYSMFYSIITAILNYKHLLLPMNACTVADINNPGDNKHKPASILTFLHYYFFIITIIFC